VSGGERGGSGPPSARTIEARGVRLSAEGFGRTPDPLTPMNHALLSGGERWYGRLSEIAVPALVIHGTEDPVPPYAHGEALARKLPDARMLTLWSTGHELHPADWPAILDAVAGHTGRAVYSNDPGA